MPRKKSSPRNNPRPALSPATLQRLLTDRDYLRKFHRNGQCRYQMRDGARLTFYSSEFFVNAVARAEKARNAGASNIQIRFNSAQKWIDFPEAS